MWFLTGKFSSHSILDQIYNEWSKKFNDQFLGLGGFIISAVFIVRQLVE